MKKVYAVMVGDLFHCGHVAFLRNAKGLGDYLVVGVAPDSEVVQYKRRPIMTAEERKCVIVSCRYVDEVIDQSGPTTTKFMRDHGFNVFVYAVATEEEDERNHQEFYADLEDNMIVRLPYSPGISTTQLIDRVRQRLREE